jgi:hypothetical protein
MLVKMKAALVLVVLLSLVLALSSFAKAPLEVSVGVEHPQIMPLQNQMIDTTTNERGVGILFVLQPANGTPWADFLDEHPTLQAIWQMLPEDVRTRAAESIGKKIVSFLTVSVGSGGGIEIATFPEDFTGVNGVPATTTMGEYKVIFAYLSYERTDGDESRCWLLEVDFDCGSWNVIPEVPGTIVASTAMVFALIGYLAIPKLRRGKRIRL